MGLRLVPKRHVQTADAARDSRSWEMARIHYEAALKDNPGLAPIWVQLGHVRKELGDLAGAEAAYRRALRLGPGVADTHFHLAHLLKGMGRRDEAVRGFMEALRLEPGMGDGALRGELERLGYTAGGVRAFEAFFSAPLEMRKGQDSVWFSLHATISGIDSAEVLGLQGSEGLYLGCVLHGETSGQPEGAGVTGRLDAVDDRTLLGRFVLPYPDRAVQLARVGFFHDRGGVRETWGDGTAAWTVLELPDDDLSRHYAALVRAE